MKRAANRELHRIWTALRGDRAAPDREDIDPSAIRAVITETFMLDGDPEAGFPVRLAGARIAELFLADVKDVPFPDLFGAEDRDTISSLLLSVLDDPTPVVAGVSAAPAGREAADLELLLLPLGPLRTARARVLGSLTPATRPAWFGLVAVEPLCIVSLRILRPSLGRDAPLGAHDRDHWLNFPMRAHGDERQPIMRQPYLTLYDG